MTTIHHEILAACPPERVWALLADLEAVQHYNPGVRHAAIEGALHTGVGARRSCELLPKGRVVERVTHWEDSRAVGLELESHDWPIDAMCIGVDKDDLIVRCAKDEAQALLAKKGVREFDLSGGRPMKGWLLVGPEGTGTAAGLTLWIDFARGRALQPQKTAKNAVGRRPKTR